MIFEMLSGNFSLEYVLGMLIALPFLFFALSFHEYAHAYAAYKQGDNYARMMGRMTVNPLKHIDPMGFLMMVLVGFGWAKPVPIVPSNFRNGKRSMILVSIAGVLTNLLLAFITLNLLYFLNYTCGLYFMGSPEVWAEVLTIALTTFISINITLCVFNLIPLPPLDGYKVVRELLYSYRTRNVFNFLDMHGNIILIVVVLMGGTSGIIYTIGNAILNVMTKFCELIY